MPDFDVSNRVIVITGAAQGIGYAVAQSFAARAAIVIIVDQNGPAAERAADSCRTPGTKALAIEANISHQTSVDRMVDSVLQAYGRIDVLINNAAIFSSLTRRPFYELPVEEWKTVIDVNVTGPFLCARAVAPAMRDNRWGRIINISSNTVEMGRPNFLHYVTSKAAVVGMTRGMARELGDDGITVNAIMPTLTKTEVEFKGMKADNFQSLIDRQCIRRTGRPDDLFGILHFMSSPASDFMTGQTVAVDGGAVHL